MVIGESAYDVHRIRGFVLESADLLTCQGTKETSFHFQSQRRHSFHDSALHNSLVARARHVECNVPRHVVVTAVKPGMNRKELFSVIGYKTSCCVLPLTVDTVT